jgi:hypothetical protein
MENKVKEIFRAMLPESERTLLCVKFPGLPALPITTVLRRR